MHLLGASSTSQANKKVTWKKLRGQKRKLLFSFFSKKFGWGALPPDPWFLAGGVKPPDPPLKRSFVTVDRGGETGPPRSNDFFFGAADDTGAADDRPAGRLA